MINKISKKLVMFKNDIVYISLIVLLILAYFTITRPSNNQLINQYQDSVKSFRNDLTIKEYLEGKNLEEIIKDNSKEILESSSNKNYFLLIILNNFTCYSCIKFHLEEIEQLNRKGMPVYAIAFNKNQLIKSFISKAVCIETDKNNIKFPFSYELLVFLINKEGNILKADAADKNNYLKSISFYKIIERYINNMVN